MSHVGKLYVISAPSGTGKTTLVRTLVETVPGLAVSVSHTTRPQRPAEINHVNYHFVTENEFQNMVTAGEFLEHATIYGNLYGTSRTWVNEMLARGLDIILEIDWQGGQQIHKLFPDAKGIFILPPSLVALHERLSGRNQDKTKTIEERMADVQNTVAHCSEYDYLVINDDFNVALEELSMIIHAERLAQPRQRVKYAGLLEELSVSKVW